MSRPNHISRPTRIPYWSGRSTSSDDEIGRRQFLTACASALASSTATTLLADDPQPPGEKAVHKTVEINVGHGAPLQSEYGAPTTQAPKGLSVMEMTVWLMRNMRSKVSTRIVNRSLP